MEIDIAARITAVTSQFATDLVLDDGTVVQLESPAELTLPGADTVVVDPSDETEPSRLASLTERVVNKIDVDDADGTLTVELADGSRLVVGPDPDFEAWTLRLPDGTTFVCQPGGGVTRFPGHG